MDPHQIKEAKIIRRGSSMWLSTMAVPQLSDCGKSHKRLLAEEGFSKNCLMLNSDL